MSNIISLLSAIGLGGILGAIIKHYLDKRTELNVKLKSINEEKYRTILIYMSIILNPKNVDYFILNDNILSNLKSNEDINGYCQSKIREYYYQSVLYASDEVMRSLKQFILVPDRKNYVKAAKKMRMDLWNNKTELKEEELLEE